MRVSRAVTSDDVTVRRLDPLRGRGPVFYASLPATPNSSGTDSDQAKQRLISSLWEYRAAGECPGEKKRHSSARTSSPIRLVRGALGRPVLRVGEDGGPSISFSRGGGKVWAALSGDESAVGIDLAGGDEFRSGYPLERVFHPEELEHALGLTGGEQQQASALLWSVKEALVKALGCGFHLVDPLQISVHQAAGNGVGEDGWHSFPAALTGKALTRFPLAADRTLWVHAAFLQQMWLSIALLDPGPALHA